MQEQLGEGSLAVGAEEEVEEHDRRIV